MKPRLFVPLVTYPDANSDAIVTHALVVSAQLGGNLDAVAFNVDIPDVRTPLSRLLMNVPEMIAAAEKESRRRGDALLQRFKEASVAGNIALNVERISGAIALLGQLAAERARYFDLSLVGWEGSNPTSHATAEAVVFGSGRPAILLPELVAIEAIRSVAIAWDGSRVAARAVAVSMLFLRQATEVHVFTVTDEKPLEQKEAGERLARQLGRSGINAKAVKIAAEDSRIAVTLQAHAIDMRADLLVMGGYGHSRVRDFVLGGATEGVLTDLRLPILMSH